MDNNQTNRQDEVDAVILKLTESPGDIVLEYNDKRHGLICITREEAYNLPYALASYYVREGKQIRAFEIKEGIRWIKD